MKFILEKKREYEKKMAEYEKEKDGELEELRDLAAAEKEQGRDIRSLDINDTLRSWERYSKYH